MNIGKKAQDIKEAEAFLVLQIKEILNELPDNPNITRAKNGSGEFTINSNKFKIDSVMQPEYHDFKYQYKILSEILDARGLAGFVSTLGQLKQNTITKHKGLKIQFNKTVIDNVVRGFSK